jgi:hypothetical protein
MHDGHWFVPSSLRTHGVTGRTTPEPSYLITWRGIRITKQLLKLGPETPAWFDNPLDAANVGQEIFQLLNV